MPTLKEVYHLEKIIKNVYELVDKKSNIHTNIIAKKHENKKSSEHEATILEKIKHINGVPKLIQQVGRYILMNKIEGQDLYEIMDSDYEFPEWEIKIIIKQILLILQELHKLDIVHRDLKLENIVYNKETKVVTIIDFNQHVTPIYTSPEIINANSAKTAVQATDMWGVGIIGYILAEKKYPFNNITHICKKSPNKMTSDTSKNFKDFIMRCFEKDPSKRITIEQAFIHSWLK